jgi:tripartite-type tricarboxylate transporter receptor subunit TctC
MKRGRNFINVVLCVFIISILIDWNNRAESQENYPKRPIEIIVPYAAGGSTDLSARIVTAYLSKSWGSPINVINKPGGNTVPALLELYQSPPDGYTLLAEGNGSSSMLPVVVKDLPFKIIDRTFVSITIMAPQVIIVSSTSDCKSIKDLEAIAKKSPETFTWTSLGGTGPNDFGTRQFLKHIGVDVSRTKPIMSQGGSQSVIHTAGGHVVMGFSSLSSALPAIKAGTVIPLAVTGGSRFQDLPDVPTTAEVGYPITAVQWCGISGPPNLPRHILEKWEKSLQQILKNEEVIAKLRNIGQLPFYHDANAAREFIANETTEVEKLWRGK